MCDFFCDVILKRSNQIHCVTSLHKCCAAVLMAFCMTYYSIWFPEIFLQGQLLSWPLTMKVKVKCFFSLGTHVAQGQYIAVKFEDDL